ncbi:hypothetical protein QFZ61_002386 [Arthrobacter sp. B3I4]|nr:hypothetical protein [Arthrobacter sp. B3I4]
MSAKLTVTVAVDLDSRSVAIRPAGTLTHENVRGLLAVVHRAERTLPGFAVHVDPGHVSAASGDAFEDLRVAGALILPLPDRRRDSRRSERRTRFAA